MEKLSREKYKEIENRFSSCNSNISENVTIKGHDCRYAFFTPNGKLMLLGITQETYKRYKKDIESARERGMERKRVAEIENNWITRTLAGSILHTSAISWETGITYFKLNFEVPRSVWHKISSYFSYVNKQRDYDDDNEIDGEYGWSTTISNKEKIKAIIKKEADSYATQEHIQAAETLRKECAASELEEKKIIANKKRQEKIIAELKEVFKNAEQPDPKSLSPEEASKFQEGYEKMQVAGERIDDPLYPENIYGGGNWYVLQPQKKWIWMIQNNGSDGSDWSCNNVKTGGAGAIGKRIRWDDKVADQIRQLK